MGILTMAEKFNLKWNDFHSNVSKSFILFRNEEYLHDVTLASDDQNKVSAHKLVLSACSEYFRNIFKNNQHAPPLLCLDGVSTNDLKNIMDYIYNGEVQIFQDNLDRFLAVAQRLKLEGLIGGNNDEDQDYKKDTTKEEYVQNKIEETIVEYKDQLTPEKKAQMKQQNQNVRTVAVAKNVDDQNPINEQVYQYLEECSEGSYNVGCVEKLPIMINLRKLSKDTT